MDIPPKRGKRLCAPDLSGVPMTSMFRWEISANHVSGGPHTSGTMTVAPDEETAKILFRIQNPSYTIESVRLATLQRREDFPL